MNARGRSEENGIPIEFIHSLHNVYEDWLIHKTLGSIDTPILVIDADLSKDEMMKSYEAYKSKILGVHWLKSILFSFVFLKLCIIISFAL